VEHLQSALEPYRHFDPLGWVGVFRFLPVWGGLLAMVVGVLMMLFGGRALFRLIAGPLGALIATIWAVPLAQRLGLNVSLRQVSLIATAVLFVAGVAFPPAVVFFAFGVPAGLLGGELAGPNDWALGFGPAFLVGGGLGVVMHRVVGAVLSAAVGAWVTMLGLLATLVPFVPPVGWFAENPVAVICLAAIFAIAGGVFQIFVRPSEEEAKNRKLEKAIAKKKAKEQKALEERWAKYTDSKK
jgi:hypothetical protein